MALHDRKIMLAGRVLELRLTRAAASALEQTGAPPAIEMEIYFSCLLRKRVHFLRAAHADAAACVPLNERVNLFLRPVMTRACLAREVAVEPDTEAFPLERLGAFVPKWIALDYRRGAWSGDFGY